MDQPAISSDLIRGHIDTIILHTLLNGDKFAQQISDAIEEKSNSEYKINQATLYSSLKRLENLKYVTSYWNDSDLGGRRKFFKLTDAGNQFVNDNLSNWSYSRSIIDKLMDCTTEPIYRTQIVEKIVEVPVEVQVVKEVEVPVPQSVLVENTEKTVDETMQSEQKLEEKPKTTLDFNQEINFRAILNGIIKATAIEKPKEEQTELTPISDDPAPKIEPEIVKFNDAMIETDYNASSSYNGKIDFGDLSLKAAKEGYKLSISSKETLTPQGTLLINRLKLFTALFTYLFALVEFMVLSFTYGSTLKLSTTAICIAIVALTIFPAIALINYLKYPRKISSKSIDPDSILTTAIVVFDLLLINLAAAFLFNLNFSDLYSVLLFIVIPIALYFDVMLYFVVKFFASKNKLFNLTKKK